MAPIPIRVIRHERQPYSIRMSRVLARKLGAYVPDIKLFGQIRRGASNVPMIVIIPNMWPASQLPDGGSVLAWDIREDDEGDIKRRDKEAA